MPNEELDNCLRSAAVMSQEGGGGGGSGVTLAHIFVEEPTTHSGTTSQHKSVDIPVSSVSITATSIARCDVR